MTVRGDVRSKVLTAPWNEQQAYYRIKVDIRDGQLDTAEKVGEMADRINTNLTWKSLQTDLYKDLELKFTDPSGDFLGEEKYAKVFREKVREANLDPHAFINDSRTESPTSVMDAWELL